MYVGLEATLDASSRPFELTSVDTAQFCLCKKPNKHDKLDFRAFVLKHKILSRPFAVGENCCSISAQKITKKDFCQDLLTSESKD